MSQDEHSLLEIFRKQVIAVIFIVRIIIHIPNGIALIHAIVGV